jgi:hypothetical protein
MRPSGAGEATIWWNGRVRGDDRVGRGIAAGWLPLALGLAAALPIIVSIGHVIAVGWAPIGDDGIIAIRSYDVFSGHSPLLGLPSSGPSGVLDQQVYHPGPLLFWLLAVPAHFLGAISLPITMGLVNCACVVGSVVLADRRGGLPLAVAVAVAFPVMLASVPAEAYTDIWNPAAPLLPTALLMFVAWSLACGEYRLLPVAVLLGSFAAQSHLIYSLPALGMLLVGVIGLLLTRRSAPGRLTADKSWVRWVVAAIAVGLLCWSAPLVDQVTNQPGNLVLLSRAARADEPTLGLGLGRRALIHAVGTRPWWLQAPRSPLERIGDLGTHPNGFAIGSAVVVLGGLIGVLLVGWRRGRGDVVAAAAVGLALSAALVLTTASIPQTSFASVGYALLWAAPAGMFIWVSLFWSVAVLIPAAVWEAVRSHRLAPAHGAATGLALAATAGILVAVSVHPRAQPFDQLREVTSSVNAALGEADSVRVDATFGGGGFFVGRGFQFGTIYALRRHGRSVTAPPVEVLIGSQYGERGSDRVVNIDAGGDREPPGRTVARVVVPPERTDDPFSKAHAVTVTASVVR